MSNQNEMISNVMRLTETRNIEDIQVKREVQVNEVVVEPYLLSICHADLRYFTGERRKEALEEKLPMALFHEGIGRIVFSKHPDFQEGDRVVVVPSIPGYLLKHTKKSLCCNNCKNGGPSNYCEKGVFLGSGYDGLAQDKLVIHGENVLKIPAEINDDIALLSELISVSLYAINVAQLDSLEKEDKVAVFGDGPVGYLTSTALHYIYGISKEKLLVFGAEPNKIKQFKDFATINLVHDFNFHNVTGVKRIFECTGGKYSTNAINQAIDLVDRHGSIVLMGVTEELVPINTRDVLEKGIHLLGSSRSRVEDFEVLIESFKDERYRKALYPLIPEKTHVVKSAKELEAVLDEASQSLSWEKVYIHLEW